MKIERKRQKFINIQNFLILFEISLGLDMEQNSISWLRTIKTRQVIKINGKRRIFLDEALSFSLHLVLLNRINFIFLNI